MERAIDSACDDMTELGSCFGGLFGGKADFSNRDNGYMDATIRSGQVRLAALIWIFFILTIMSVFVELVNGYCIGGGAAGVTWSAMPHGVWQIPNLVVAVFALQAIYFDCNLDMEANVTSLLVGMWFVLLTCLVNIIHLVALCFEVGNANSTFWLQNNGAWVWTILVFVVICVLWTLLLARHLHIFKMDLGSAHYTYGWMPNGSRSDGLLPATTTTNAHARAQVNSRVFSVTGPRAGSVKPH